MQNKILKNREDLKVVLKEMKNQYILSIDSHNLKNTKYYHLFFLKINNDRYLACDVIQGFVLGNIIEENYMSLDKVSTMIYGYIEEGYKFSEIFDPKFNKEIK